MNVRCRENSIRILLRTVLGAVLQLQVCSDRLAAGRDVNASAISHILPPTILHVGTAFGQQHTVSN